jgi:hypothetical protein
MRRFVVALVVALCGLFVSESLAQVDTAWVRRYSGPGNSEDEAKAIAVDRY